MNKRLSCEQGEEALLSTYTESRDQPEGKLEALLEFFLCIFPVLSICVAFLIPQYMLFMVTLECPNFPNNLSRKPFLRGFQYSVVCICLNALTLVTGCFLSTLHFQGMSIAFLP